LVGILKATEERSRFRIGTKISQIHNTAVNTGSANIVQEIFNAQAAKGGLRIKRVFGTDSDQNGMLEEIPRSGTDSYR
jgi:hypothetical protein